MSILEAKQQAILKNCQINNVRYARITHGNACAFCIMLSGRNVYSSQKAAGNEENKFHRYCNCSVVANIDDDAKKIVAVNKMYQQMYEQARSNVDPKGPNNKEQNRKICQELRKLYSTFCKDMDTKGKFLNSEQEYLEPHEVKFVNQMIKMGNSLEWVKRD